MITLEADEYLHGGDLGPKTARDEIHCSRRSHIIRLQVINQASHRNTALDVSSIALQASTLTCLTRELLPLLLFGELGQFVSSAIQVFQLFL